MQQQQGRSMAARRDPVGHAFLLVQNQGNLTLSDPVCLVCMVSANGDLLIVPLQFTLFF